jgi:hypothetical protein
MSVYKKKLDWPNFSSNFDVTLKSIGCTRGVRVSILYSNCTCFPNSKLNKPITNRNVSPGVTSESLFKALTHSFDLY